MFWILCLIITLAFRSAEAWIPKSASTVIPRRAAVSIMSTSSLFSAVDDKQGEKNRHEGDGWMTRSNDRRSIGSGSFENDLEQARNALEDLIKTYPDSSSIHHSIEDTGRKATEMNSPSIIMTSAGRRRRQIEMGLLRQLIRDDDAAKAASIADDAHVQDASENDNTDDVLSSSVVDELMHLWMFEHGPEPAALLEAMQQTCSPGMALEEAQLRDMMDQYPTWAEPRARLAILLFMKGISDESRDLALEALKLKPWHFDVYPILIMISLRNEDMGQALYWARQSLPTYRPNSAGNRSRLQAWVDRALAQASEQWEEAERATFQRQQFAVTNDSNTCWQ